LRIKREIEILKTVKHTNIVECYDVIETDKSWFMILEYCSGGELFDYIVKRQSLSENEAVDFFKQILNGIEYCHQLGICHRDLKLENILIDGEGTIKIADFGLSQVYKNGETMRTRCGSPQYLPPEMIKGECYEGLSVDLWSAGVIFYGMVMGCLPFDEEIDAKMFKRIATGNYRECDELSIDCQHVIQRMFEANPNIRISLDEIREHIMFRDPQKSFNICIEVEEI